MDSPAVEQPIAVPIQVQVQVPLNLIEAEVMSVSDDIINEVITTSSSTTASTNTSSESSPSQPIPDRSPDEEPAKKRLKSDGNNNLGQSSEKPPSSSTVAKIKEKLEQRLGGILCCAVCLDLPKSAIFQCTNGHLMCAGCFTHLLADARLRDETASCPNCRCVISRELCSRNLAVEKAVCELPGQCRFCQSELPRAQLDKHQDEHCDERIVRCWFARIGCPWRGPHHEAASHAETCIHPEKSGRDVLSSLQVIDKEALDEKKLYDQIFDLLSFEKITFNDLQFKPYRTDEYIHKLYYETSRFTAFNTQWVVKARVNDDQRDPTQSCERQLSYQIVLKSKLTAPLVIHYVVLKGPFGDMKLFPRIYKHEFNENSAESPFSLIPLFDTAECNKLLAAKAINFRLIMFQMQK